MKIYLEGSNQEAFNHRQRFFAKQGVDPTQVVMAEVVHGTQVAEVFSSHRGQILAATDALLTRDPEVILSVTVADCAPIYLFDPVQVAVGLVHAGWRGAKENVLGAAIEGMVNHFGTKPKDLRVIVGPHLQAHHFEIQEDLAKQFQQIPEAVIKQSKTRWLNLGRIFLFQLAQRGVPTAQVQISPDCTACLTDHYFSYRRDHPARVEAMVAYGGIKKT